MLMSHASTVVVLVVGMIGFVSVYYTEWRRFGDMTEEEKRKTFTAIQVKTMQHHTAAAAYYNHHHRKEDDRNHKHNSDDNDDGTQQDKYFILHIGPPKTASSTIQYEMKATKKTYLHDDDYYIVGKRGDRGCKLNAAINDEWCNREVGKYMRNTTLLGTLPECWNGMTDGIAELKDQRNILFSSESINLPGWSTSYEWYDVFNAALEREGFKLIVVAVYRRLFQWLPSVHNQHTKHFIGTGWGRHNEPLIPLILDSQYVRYDDGGGRPLWFAWLPTYLAEIPYHVETRILNLHVDFDRTVGTKFFCDMIPNAPNTCQYMLNVQNGTNTQDDQQRRREIRRHLIEEDNNNVAEREDNNDNDDDNDGEEVRNRSLESGLLYYDFISVAAADAGYVNMDQYHRSVVNKAVGEYQTGTLHRGVREFPLICATEEQLYRLLDASMYWEQTLFPNMYDLEDEHRDAFWMTANDNKFCTINATATLELEEWKAFFIDNFQHNMTKTTNASSSFPEDNAATAVVNTRDRVTAEQQEQEKAEHKQEDVERQRQNGKHDDNNRFV